MKYRLLRRNHLAYQIENRKICGKKQADLSISLTLKKKHSKLKSFFNDLFFTTFYIYKKMLCSKRKTQLRLGLRVKLKFTFGCLFVLTLQV